MIAVLLLSSALAWAGPLREPHKTPAWVLETGLKHEGGRWIQVRPHPRRRVLATAPLSPAEVDRLDAYFAAIPEGGHRAVFQKTVVEYLASRGITALHDTLYFEPSDRGLVLSEAGVEAVPGIVVGDPIGDRFTWPEESPFERPIRLGPHIAARKAMEIASLSAAEAFDGARPAPAPRAVDLSMRLPTYRDLPPDARKTPIETWKTPPARDWTGKPIDTNDWYVMSRTRGWWLSKQAKAEAWRRDEFLRRLYDYDVQRFFGRKLGGSDIAALVDVVIVRVHQEYPNMITGYMIAGMRIYEYLVRTLPVEFRHDFKDYWKDRWQGPIFAEETIERSELLLEDEPVDDAAFREPGEKPWYRELWDWLNPSLKLRIKPRFKLDEPSAKVGAKLRLRPSDRLSFSAGGDYDTKDNEWAFLWALKFDF